MWMWKCGSVEVDGEWINGRGYESRVERPGHARVRVRVRVRICFPPKSTTTVQESPL